MKFGDRQSRSLFVIVILVAAASLWSTSGFMRKNDQATILAGAYDWARGDRQEWSRYYQFDKTYVLYAYNAAWLRVHRSLFPEANPVKIANRATAAAFWLALGVFVGRYRQRLDPLILLSVLLAPAILLNTQYVNSSTLSSAFLLLSLAALPAGTDTAGGAKRPWAAAAFLFLAVGSRADIVLLLPLYLWLITPFPLTGKWVSFCFHRVEKTEQNFPLSGKMLKNFSIEWKTQIALGFSAILALVLGRLWTSAGTTLDPFFQWKMAAGYIAFGFGAASLVYMMGGLKLLGGDRQGSVGSGDRQGAGELVWRELGFLSFLIPVLFFLPQLHAPRYFWRGCEAILMLAALSPTVWRIQSRGWRVCVCAATLVPFFIGLSMPEWGKPRPTPASPTVFPSGDGHYPMGAYASFLWRFRQAETEPIDHNQRVWWAAQSAAFEPDESGSIRVLASPMGGYLFLAASLQGLTAQQRGWEDLRGQTFYLDSRTLARSDVKFRQTGLFELLDGPLEIVSAEFDGIAILRTGSGDGQWGERAKLLNRLFAGNEYRIGPGAGSVPAGHQAVWFDAVAFPGSQQDESTGWYYGVERSPTEWVAWSALPDWMSMQRFSGSP